MVYTVPVLVVLVIGGWLWLSRRREQQRIDRRVRRHERRLEDQRIWEAAVAERTARERGSAD